MPSPLASNSRILPAAQQACGAIIKAGHNAQAAICLPGLLGERVLCLTPAGVATKQGLWLDALRSRPLATGTRPRRSVALQNTHDGAWPSRTPTTKCGPPEHPRPSAALQNTEKCGHDGAWPSKITRRVRPRRSVALRVALQHARSAQTLHDVTQYSAGQGQAACRTGLSECSSERCNPLTGAYHFARLAPGSRWPHGSSQDVTCQRQV